MQRKLLLNKEIKMFNILIFFIILFILNDLMFLFNQNLKILKFMKNINLRVILK